MKTRFSPRTRQVMAVLVAVVAMLATSCGSEAVVLQGDIAERAATAQGADGSEPGAEEATTAAQATPDPGVVLTIEDPEAPSEPTAEPTPEVTESGVITQVVASGGAVDTLNNVQLALGETVATSATIESYFDGEREPEDSKHWLVTELDADTLGYVSSILSAGSFTLIDEAGNRHSADSVYDLVADRQRTELDGLDSASMSVAFPTAQLISDTTGWMLEVSTSDAIPLLMPLSGSRFNHQYPLSLADGIESSLDVSTDSDCEGVVFDTRVDLATIALEGRDLGSDRMPLNERIVTIDLAIAGTPLSAAAPSSDRCGFPSNWPELVLNIDGRPVATTRYQAPAVEGLSETTLPLEFQIPASATVLELASGTNSLATWEVSLPAAVGEPGADLVPFNASRVQSFERAVPGQRPEALTTTTLSDGGGSGVMSRASFGLRDSVATNSSPEEYINGSPVLDPEGRTWLIVGTDIEGLDGVNRTQSRANFSLQSPDGRRISATTMYDRAGDTEHNIGLYGVEFHDIRMVFETDGLVEDLDGWSFLVSSAGVRSLELAMIGATPDDGFPAALAAPLSSEVTTEPFVACADGGIIDVTIDEAALDIEGIAENRFVRVDNEQLLVTMELSITNLRDDQFKNSNCGLISAWPEFLLTVDGRRTRPLYHATPNLDQFETGMASLRFVIPEDSQTVSLIGGSGSTVIGSFQLRDAGQVLADLGATQVDARTVITLDETLLFAFGESTLQQDAIAPLNRVANVLKSESSGEVTVVGHTDAIGDDASNRALSLARGEAVAEELIQAGVDPDRLVISGEGESSPVAPNENDDGTDNPAGRAQNRRVEISFTSD